MTATETPETGLMPYTGGQVEEYRARIVMTPEDAKALDAQLRACTLAVLRESVDYGTIPGTDDRKVLFKPGAEKLLQWFGLAFTCDRTETEYDSDNRKEGVTYRATITRQLPGGHIVTVATCEGYAGYDEAKFFTTAEQAQFKAEAKERMWAEKDRRVANPNKWKHLTEYRAPWNTIIRMAQKRALVGATVDATAAAGLFSAEDGGEDTAAAADDGPTPAMRLLEEAATFTTEAAGQQIWRDAATAARDGQCTPGQATHIQNRIRLRLRGLVQAAQPVHVGDLARQAASAPPDASPAERQHPAAAPQTPPAESAGEAPDEQEVPTNGDAATSDTDQRDGAVFSADSDYDTPGTVTRAQLTKLGALFTGLGFTGKEREQRLVAASQIAGRELGSSSDLSVNEASTLISTLEGCEGSRDALIALLVDGEKPEGSDG